jgi:hypothetical protein
VKSEGGQLLEERVPTTFDLPTDIRTCRFGHGAAGTLEEVRVQAWFASFVSTLRRWRCIPRSLQLEKMLLLDIYALALDSVRFVPSSNTVHTVVDSSPFLSYTELSLLRARACEPVRLSVCLIYPFFWSSNKPLGQVSFFLSFLPPFRCDGRRCRTRQVGWFGVGGQSVVGYRTNHHQAKRRKAKTNIIFSIPSIFSILLILQSSLPYTTASPSSFSPSPNTLNCPKITRSSTMVPKLPINHGIFVITYSLSRLWNRIPAP